MLRIHVEMLFKGRKHKPDLTYHKYLELPHKADKLDIETAILQLPFITAAEARGFTLTSYDWEAEVHAPTSNTLQ